MKVPPGRACATPDKKGYSRELARQKGIYPGKKGYSSVTAAAAAAVRAAVLAES